MKLSLVHHRRVRALLAIGIAAFVGVGCGQRSLRAPTLDAPMGLGVCYGPYRAGQSPSGEQPTRAQLREDLALISRDFHAIRTYGASGLGRDMLEIIRDNSIRVRVLLGAWIAPEPENAAANEAEIDAAIALANEFPDVVAAVVVGNETQVSWSGHRVDPGVLIGHIRRVRESVRVPVTTADDFSFWLEPGSRAVADEIDFIVAHAYAMWNGKSLDEAIAFTEAQVRAVEAAHRGHRVVLGETGWATRKHTEGEQATLIQGVPGEAEQADFFDALRAWAAETRTPTFYFEAFDEPWKGGAHPDEVEKHWGLYTADRRPKTALTRAHLDARLIR